MEIAGRDLPTEQVTINPFSNPEIHAHSSLVCHVGLAGPVDILLSKEAAAPRLCLDLVTLLTEDFRHLLHAQLFVDRVRDELT